MTEKGRRWLENAEEWHALTDYLVKDARTNTSSVTEKGRKEAKEARLSFRIVARCGELALAEIALDTGRHHPSDPGADGTCGASTVWGCEIQYCLETVCGKWRFWVCC